MTATPFISYLYTDWKALAVLAAAGSVLASVMLIMFSRLFDLRSLEQNAKAEFVFAASTVFIVLFTLGLVTFGDTVIKQVAVEMYWNTIASCPPGADPQYCQMLQGLRAQVKADTLIDVMQLYLEPPAKCSQEFLNFMYYAAIPIDACASLYMEIFMSEQMTCFGLKWASERIANTTQMLTFYIFAYFLITHTLAFIKYYAGFFFSVGVVLRAFPPTRGAGAYLMAICVGLYFVFPFAYILITTMSMPQADQGLIGVKGTAQLPAGGLGIAYLCGTPVIGDVSGLDCGTGSGVKTLELLGWLKANRPAIQDFFDFNIPAMMRQLVSIICVFPFVAFVILMTFVLNTTNLFGGNIPEIGRGLVRLI